MNTTALIVEFLVTGFMVFATIFFIILSILDFKNFNFLMQVKDFSNILMIVILIISYLFGSLLHRITSPNSLVIQSLTQIRFLNNLLKLERGWQSNEWRRMYYFVLEHGSTALIERIDYMQSLGRLFKNTAIVFPFFGFTFAVWLTKSSNNLTIGIIVFLLCILFSLFLTIAASSQYESFRKGIEMANQIIREEIDLKTNK